MNLDSARGLKADFAALLRPTVAVAAYDVAGAYRFERGATRAFDVHAQPMRALSLHQPVVATGIHKQKKNDYRLAIRIQRRAFEDSPPIEAIRKQAKGEIDVRYVGTIVKRATPWNRQRHRPVEIGSSVGHFSITAGTVGCFVRKPGTKSAIALLSNNHVLANENNAKAGDAIIQPGGYDNGKRQGDAIGMLFRYIPLNAAVANSVDCALATLNTGIVGDVAALHGVGVLAGEISDDDFAEVDAVEKLGRTTGHTKGRITAFEVDAVTVNYDMGKLRFDGQLEIEGSGTRAFSDGGDSGSLIFTSGGRLACGLLFAGSDHGGSNGKGLTYANPISTVMDQLKTELIVS